MTYIVDQLFPPIKPDEVAAVEFSHFNYWRDPIPEIDLNLFENCNNTTTNGSTSILNGIGNSINANSNASDHHNNSTLNGSHAKTLTTIPEN